MYVSELTSFKKKFGTLKCYNWDYVMSVKPVKLLYNLGGNNDWHCFL